MKFWQFHSIFREEPHVLEQLLQDPKWLPYLRGYRDISQYVNSQDRTVLDADVPTDLAEAAMERCAYRFQVKNGYLYLRRDECLDTLSSAEVFKRYGGEAIEEVLEYSSYRIPTA